MSDFQEQLFPNRKPETINLFSCGHTIPDDNLKVFSLEKGPTGKLFNFNFQERNNYEMIEEFSRVLVNFSKTVPGGIVCFFPSFNYISLIMEKWKQLNVIQSLEKKKKVFFEPRETNLVEQTLINYEACIKNSSNNVIYIFNSWIQMIK